MIADIIIKEIRRVEAAQPRVTRCPPMAAKGVMSWDGSYAKTEHGGKVPVTNAEITDPTDNEYGT